MDNSDRTVIRGGYGIFYARTPSILTNTALAQNGLQVRTYTLFPTDPLFPELPHVLTAAPPTGAAPSIFVMDPNFVSPAHPPVEPATSKPRSGTDFALSVGYLGVHGLHLTRTRDVNLFPAVPVAAVLPDGTPITYYRHPGTNSPARPNPAFGRISVFDSGADSDYNALSIQVHKALRPQLPVPEFVHLVSRDRRRSRTDRSRRRCG